MIVGFTQYSRDNFLFILAAGSVVGSLIGGLLRGIVPSAMLIPVLSVFLLISAVEVWTPRSREDT